MKFTRQSDLHQQYESICVINFLPARLKFKSFFYKICGEQALMGYRFVFL